MAIRADGNQLWEENQLTDGVAEEANQFGAAVAISDLNSDGFADLAIGVPGDNAGPLVAAGAVRVLYGTPTGLSAIGDQFWNQNRLTGGSEAGDRFGSALAAGDFDSDGFNDLAVGVPNEDIRGISNAGAVNVIYGTATGLTATASQLWHRNTNGIKGFATDHRETTHQDIDGQRSVMGKEKHVLAGKKAGALELAR